MQGTEDDGTVELSEKKSNILLLAEQLEEQSKKILDKKIQKEIARIVNILPLLDKENDPVLDAQARISASALRSETPNLELAELIITRLEERLRARAGLFSTGIRNGSPALSVVFGLGVLLYFIIPISIFSGTVFSAYKTIFGINIETLGLVAFYGALGSIVSIMVRLHEFSNIEKPDKSILFFTGLFKPIVGTSFALFVFFILNSGLLPVTINQEKFIYFFSAISFVAGFSERFAQDVVKKTETTLAGG